MTVYVEPAQFSEKWFFSYGKFSIMETSLYFDAIPVCTYFKKDD